MIIHVSLPSVLQARTDSESLVGELLRVCDEFGEVRLSWQEPAGLTPDHVLVTDNYIEADQWQHAGGTPIFVEVDGTVVERVLSRLVDLRRIIIKQSAHTRTG